jgi:uncharacterized membrane protein YcaP (DUF421 family)
MELSLFSSWPQVFGTAAGTAILYAVYIVAIRIAGRRTLAQISAFDIVVTVALGSLLAATSLPDPATIADGVAVLLTLLVMQVLLAGVRQHSDRLQGLLDFPPRVIVRDGVPDLRRSVFTEQLSHPELAAKLRKQGVTDLRGVHLVVLEPTGDVSVVRNPGGQLVERFEGD